MNTLSLRTWLSAALLGVTLALTLSVRSGEAVCGPGNSSDYCSTHYGLTGTIGAIGGRMARPGTQFPTDYPSVNGSTIANAGALIHADYKNIEQQARALLQAQLKFRQDISPSKDRPDFDHLIRRFDYESGYSRPVTTTNTVGAAPLSARLDQADHDLPQARDLYAYLAAFADEARFRQDNGAGDDPRTDYTTLCPRTRTEDDPVTETYDWCYFAARMRQAVRENAYLHMIFGQQFTVDALGLHFSGTEIVGGEAFVRDELKKLQMAVAEYDKAEKVVTDGLKRSLGNGCLVSDFYGQPEWAILSRAAEGKERAQHQIAVRMSYLDGYGTTKAQATYEDASQDQYVELVNTAALTTAPRTNASCPRGERPDGTALAQMTLNMLDTRAKAREMADGRNIFGYNIEFTPARPFRTAFGSNDTGILNEARQAAQYAKQLQSDEQQATRDFDQRQQQLMDRITQLLNGREYAIQAEAGCDRIAHNPDGTPVFATDEAYYQCVADMMTNTTACNVEAAPSTNGTADAFASCIDATVDGQPRKPDCSNCRILISTMRQSRIELRQIYLQRYAAEQKALNINQRIANEQWRTASVSGAIAGTRVAMSALDFSEQMVDAMTDTGNALRGGLLGGIATSKTLVQMAEDLNVENINSAAEVKNALLDLAEAVTDALIAQQEYKAKETEYLGVIGQTGNDLEETRRERAYLQNSPANDPSFRLVRDSARLQLANQLEYSARVSYLAARRAEYEYAARLSASNFRISDIYRARTADDILQFLQRLEAITNNILQESSDIQQEDLTLSVAVHVLGLTDQALQGQTHPRCATPGDVACVRRERFRDWVAQNTQLGAGGKPVLSFTLNTSVAKGGVFSKVVPPDDYEHFWLHKVGGLGQPKPTNTGLGLNLLTTQPGAFGYRRVVVTQTGLSELRTRAGCIFSYRLVHPAALVGQEWASNQTAEVVGSDFRASINGATGGQPTAAFLGRPVAATVWNVEVRSGAPENGLPDLDLSQLTDVELKFSTTRAFRQAGSPPLSDCVRADF